MRARGKLCTVVRKNGKSAATAPSAAITGPEICTSNTSQINRQSFELNLTCWGATARVNATRFTSLELCQISLRRIAAAAMPVLLKERHVPTGRQLQMQGNVILCIQKSGGACFIVHKRPSECCVFYCTLDMMKKRRAAGATIKTHSADTIKCLIFTCYMKGGGAGGGRAPPCHISRPAWVIERPNKFIWLPSVIIYFTAASFIFIWT